MTRPKFRKGDIVAWHPDGSCVLMMKSSKCGIVVDGPCDSSACGCVVHADYGDEVLLYRRRRPARRKGKK
jgi:hypothetical protein